MEGVIGFVFGGGSTMKKNDDQRSLLDQRLLQNPFFSSLPLDARRKIVAAAIVRRYARSVVLARELEPSDQFLLILDGSLQVCRYSDDGRKTIYRNLYRPSGIGYLLLSGEPHTAAIVAGDKALVALIPVPLIKDLLNARPESLYRAIASLSELVDDLSSEILAERTLPLQERVRRAIYKNAGQHGELRMSHEELAQHVGATRANVSRALKRLEAAGTVSLRRRTILINRDV
jgi:CRP/FNR family transcriptional regulator